MTLDDGGMMVSTCSNQGLGQPCQIVWRSPSFLLPSNAKLTARSTCLARRIVLSVYHFHFAGTLPRHFGLSSARLGSFPLVSVHTRQGDAKVMPRCWVHGPTFGRATASPGWPRSTPCEAVSTLRPSQSKGSVPLGPGGTRSKVTQKSI